MSSDSRTAAASSSYCRFLKAANVSVGKPRFMMFARTDIPWIVARGRKGGSNIAAAICNALLYEATGRQL